MAEALTAAQTDTELADLPEWKLVDGAIVREFRFPEFLDGIGFVGRVAILAEEANHHPDIDIRWTTVRLALVTHSAGGLTKKDFDLAREIDRMMA